MTLEITSKKTLMEYKVSKQNKEYLKMGQRYGSKWHSIKMHILLVENYFQTQFWKHSGNFICSRLKNKSSCLKRLRIRIWPPIIITWVWQIFSPPAICIAQPSTKPPAKKLLIIETKSCTIMGYNKTTVYRINSYLNHN